jgi:MoxR-like ATPase
MAISAKIFPANVQKAEENKQDILGVFSVPKGTVIVYRSSSMNINALFVNQSADTVIHKCTAVEKSGLSKGCWHLGALQMLFPQTPPVIKVIPEEPKWEEETLAVDLTPSLLGRPGDTAGLPLKLVETLQEVPEQEPAEENSEILWERIFKIPSGLIQKLKIFRERQSSRLTEEQKNRIPEKPLYIPRGKEVAYAIASLLADSWEAPLLIGPRGTGKSTMAETVAYLLNLPVVKIFGGIDINAEALLGGKTLVPYQQEIDTVTVYRLKAAGQRAGIDINPILDRVKTTQMRVEFEPGPLLKAITGGELVIIDEVNMLSPEVTSILHGLLDWQKTVCVPGLGPVKAHPDFRVIGAMNLGYSGTKILNEAFQDRFRSIKVEYLPQKQLVKLFEGQGIETQTARKLADLFSGLTDRVKNGDISDSCLSIRALIRAGREYQEGLGSLCELAISNITESLQDEYEALQVRDLIEVRLKGE